MIQIEKLVVERGVSDSRRGLVSDESESFYGIAGEEDAWRNQRRVMRETGVDRSRCQEMY